jgi:hypothetical protein
MAIESGYWQHRYLTNLKRKVLKIRLMSGAGGEVNTRKGNMEETRPSATFYVKHKYKIPHNWNWNRTRSNTVGLRGFTWSFR